MPHDDLTAITSRDTVTGEENGFVLPIWHIDTGPRIEQVYMTVVPAGGCKGPHLHHKRESRFVCVLGDVRIVTREASGMYLSREMGDTCGYRLIVVESGTPAAIYNIGKGEARVLNLPDPAWRDNSDEHKVTDWDYRRR
jgi:dTDP-4-dehydrorhamnose 3,5-epimerase